MFTGEYGGIGMNKTLLTILAGTIILSTGCAVKKYKPSENDYAPKEQSLYEYRQEKNPLIIKDGVYEK